MAKRRFGASASEHHERSIRHLQDMRRLTGIARRQMGAPADCEAAASTMRALFLKEGHYMIDRYDGRGGRTMATSRYKGTRRLFDKFIKTCVIKPRSAAAARKMRAVWR